MNAAVFASLHCALCYTVHKIYTVQTTLYKLHCTQLLMFQILLYTISNISNIGPDALLYTISNIAISNIGPDGRCFHAAWAVSKSAH